MDELPRIPWLRTALVAEDHEVTGRYVLRAMEGWCSGQVRLVRTQRELEQQARELGPELDLIVADLHLADGDCRSVLSEVRRATPSLRVVLTTGQLVEQQRMDLHLTFRPHVLLAKPFTCDDLHSRLLTLRPEEIAGGWYFDLVRTHGLEGASKLVRELARDHAMRDAQGDVNAAAMRLGVSRSYMYKPLAHRGDEEEGTDPRFPRRKR